MKRQVLLTLVRHGETQYNKEGVLQGQAIDSSLSVEGLFQSESAGFYLQDVVFSNVFVSDMHRAKQTAECIMKVNSSCSELLMECEPLLKEISFGSAEGGRVQDVKEMAKAAGETFPGFTPPGGETQDQVKVRVRRFLDQTLQKLGAQHWSKDEEETYRGKADDGDISHAPIHVLVVGHGAFMVTMFRYFLEELKCSLALGVDRSHVISLSPNAGISRFLVDVKKDRDAFRVSGVHCVFVHKGDHVKQQI